ncbi:hypothetical protein ABZS52_30680 [Micromonospora profundi]|uniref:hypothetical protein n=1 Tax=Micromonospora profundi TaxID=1420889 RepID=UPI00339ECC54
MGEIPAALWVARRLIHWAAYHWTADPDVAAGYAEEWTAIVDERPGKLLKLLTAVQFTLGAAGKAVPRMFAAARDAAVRKLATQTTPNLTRAIRLLATITGAVSATTMAILAGIGALRDLVGSLPTAILITAAALTLLGAGSVATILKRGRRRIRKE